MDFYSVIVLVILLFFNSICLNGELYKGSLCRAHDNSTGECKLFHDCDWIKTELEAKKIAHKDIVNCGFEGSVSLVCCPVEVSSQRFETGRKSDMACDLISKIEYPDLRNHVNRGTPAQSGEFPYLAAIGVQEIEFPDSNVTYECGANLIAKNFVLTAAHCVNKKHKPPVNIKLGRIILHSEFLFEGEEDINLGIKSVILHPKYEASKNYYDIALIEMNGSVQEYSSVVHPVCLHTGANQISFNDKLTVAGWGWVDFKTQLRAIALLKADLNLFPDAECADKYARIVTKRLAIGIQPEQICAFDYKSSDENPRDTCRGDSGKVSNLFCIFFKI